MQRITALFTTSQPITDATIGVSCGRAQRRDIRDRRDTFTRARHPRQTRHFQLTPLGSRDGDARQRGDRGDRSDPSPRLTKRGDRGDRSDPRAPRARRVMRSTTR